MGKNSGSNSLYQNSYCTHKINISYLHRKTIIPKHMLSITSFGGEGGGRLPFTEYGPITFKIRFWSLTIQNVFLLAGAVID